jgi:hypothetical protein
VTGAVPAENRSETPSAYNGDMTSVIQPATAPAVTIESCFECEHELEHCHGTALVHLDAEITCTEDERCVLGVESHIWVVPCPDDGCCDTGW